jgi:hypothetical protein
MPSRPRTRLAAVAAACLFAVARPVAAAPPVPFIHPLVNPVAMQGALFGTAVAGIGDVNGDGVGDLVVSTLGAAEVFVFSGADRSLLRTIQDPDGLTNVRFGVAVAGVGDLNGDGVDDIAVGSPGDDLIVLLPCLDPPCPPQPFQGRAFVFSGATGTLLRRLVPPDDQFLAFGFAVATLGDVNGDGVPDVAVGAPTRRSNKFGQVFLFSGTNGNLLWKSVEPAAQALASFGQSLVAIDDVNGDGRRDLLVDAPFHDYDPSPGGFLLAGRAYVVSGANGAILRTHDNPSPADGELFGAGLTGLGDETGDGVEEYALADPVAGTAWVFRGNDGALLRTITSPGSAATDFFGLPLVRVEDRDGDGRDDFWTAASRAGILYLMSATGVITSVTDPTPGASESNGGFGRSLAATADLGGDGLHDLLAGEPAEPSGGMDAGAAFVIVNDRPPVAKCRAVVRAADAVCHAAVAASEVDDGSFDPDGDPVSLTLAPPGPYALGVTVVTLQVSDGRGASDSCATTVTVTDTTPPAITGALADPSVLWPPNHRLVDVRIAYAVADNCSGPAAIACGLTVTSSEAADATGDGHTNLDATVLDPHHVRVRSERTGNGPGRAYSTVIGCSDAASNASTAAVTVTVAHDRR